MKAVVLPSLVALAICLATPSAFSQEQMFDLGAMPGGSFSQASAVSGDGTVVVGSTSQSPSNQWLFRWTAAHGMVNVIRFDGSGGVYAVSHDGAVLAGALKQGGAVRAFRWDVATGVTDLGTLGGTASAAWGISRDGQVIVGDSLNAASVRRAFRWTSVLGLQDLGSLLPGSGSSAYGVSGDGQVAVGVSTASAGERAVRWEGGQILDLGTLAGDNASAAHGVNVDGSVVVGASGADAFRWTAGGGMVGLGSLGGVVSAATGVSADGSVVIGAAALADGSGRAFRWTAASGMTSLGVLSGGTYSEANGISADGRVIVGKANTPQGERAFIWKETAGLQDLLNVHQSVQSSADTSAHVLHGQARRTRGLAELRCIPGAAQRYCLSAGSAVESGDGSHQGLGQTGAGLRINEQLSVGGSLSLANAEQHSNAADQRNEFGVGVWLAHQEDAATGAGWNATASLSMSRGDSRFQRGEDLADVQRASVQVGVRSMAQRVAVGYGVAVGRSLVTPEMALTHLRGQREGFDENDVALPLQVEGANSQQTYATLAVHSATPLSVRSSLQLSVALDAALNEDSHVLEGTSEIPGLNQFAVRSRLEQRALVPTATAGYRFAFSDNASLTTQAQVSAGAFEQQRPVYGLSVNYRYAF